MRKESLGQAKQVYLIEKECVEKMADYFDEDTYSKAIDLLKNAERIGATGCGHSGIICQHFAHLMCCIDRPARFISPAEAVHGGTGSDNTDHNNVKNTERQMYMGKISVAVKPAKGQKKLILTAQNKDVGLGRIVIET